MATPLKGAFLTHFETKSGWCHFSIVKTSRNSRTAFQNSEKRSLTVRTSTLYLHFSNSCASCQHPVYVKLASFSSFEAHNRTQSTVGVGSRTRNAPRLLLLPPAHPKHNPFISSPPLSLSTWYWSHTMNFQATRVQSPCCSCDFQPDDSVSTHVKWVRLQRQRMSVAYVDYTFYHTSCLVWVMHRTQKKTPCSVGVVTTVYISDEPVGRGGYRPRA